MSESCSGVMERCDASATSGRTYLARKVLSSPRHENLARAVSDEHADAAALVEHAVVDEHIDSLERRGGVDAVECGEFVDRWHLRLLRHGSVDDLPFDLLGDLDKDGATIVHGALLVHWLVGYVTN